MPRGLLPPRTGLAALPANLDYFIGRQPIFTGDLEVFGYELLYRERATSLDSSSSGSESRTSQVLAAVLADCGLDDLVGERYAFVNLTQSFLDGSCPLPAGDGVQRMVVEVLEDVSVTPQLRAGLEDLRRRGYLLALDDFVPGGEHEPLLPMVDIVKLDLQDLGEEAVAFQTQRLRDMNLRVVVEKIETEEEFENCRAAGVDYFQGYFLERPKLVPVKSAEPGGLNVLQLLTELRRPDVELGEIVNIVGRDVSLSYKLLKHINSSFYGLRYKVSSVEAAVQYLGLARVRELASLLAVNALDDRPALIELSMQRARMCQLIAERAELGNSERYFTVGLFSCLESLIGAPLAELLEQLPLTQDVMSALTRGAGDLGTALKCVVAYEQGDWESVDHPQLDGDALNECFVEAVGWVAGTLAGAAGQARNSDAA